MKRKNCVQTRVIYHSETVIEEPPKTRQVSTASVRNLTSRWKVRHEIRAQGFCFEKQARTHKCSCGSKQSPSAGCVHSKYFIENKSACTCGCNYGCTLTLATLLHQTLLTCGRKGKTCGFSTGVRSLSIFPKSSPVNSQAFCGKIDSCSRCIKTENPHIHEAHDTVAVTPIPTFVAIVSLNCCCNGIPLKHWWTNVTGKTHPFLKLILGANIRAEHTSKSEEWDSHWAFEKRILHHARQKKFPDSWVYKTGVKSWERTSQTTPSVSCISTWRQIASNARMHVQLSVRSATRAIYRKTHSKVPMFGVSFLKQGPIDEEWWRPRFSMLNKSQRSAESIHLAGCFNPKQWNQHNFVNAPSPHTFQQQKPGNGCFGQNNFWRHGVAK